MEPLWGAQSHMSNNYAAIWIETMREAGGGKDKATAHELGHTGDLEDEDNDTTTCLMARPTEQNPEWGDALCDQCIAILRNNAVTWGGAW